MDNEAILEIAEKNAWMTDVDRLVNLYWALSQVLVFEVEGDIVELGCHAGGTSVFLQMIIDHFDPLRQLHVYDSFQGLPEPGPPWPDPDSPPARTAGSSCRRRSRRRPP